MRNEKILYSKRMALENHLHVSPIKRRRHYGALLLLLPAIVFALILILFVLQR